MTAVAPSFTVVVPVLEGTAFTFRELRQSVLAQTVGDWTLVVVGPSIDQAAVVAGTPAGVSANDPRIVVLHSGSSLHEALTTALGSVSSDYVMVAQQDGLFTPEAGGELRDAIAEAAAGGDELPDLVYTDEGTTHGERQRLILKPDFSPERLRCQHYLGNPVFFRADFIRSTGGFRDDIDGAELYELALRVARDQRRTVHVSTVAFSTPKGTRDPWVLEPGALEAVRTVLTEHLAATGGGTVEVINQSGVHRTHRPVVDDPLVSIIIPTRGGYGDVRGVSRCMVIDAVTSVVDKTTYENYEIVIVLDTVADPAVKDELQRIGGARLRFVMWDKPFNFSAKMNLGVFHSRGEYLLFLNDDTEVIAPSWIEPMLALCQRPGAGMAGAMLYFEDDTIQHAGHLYEAGDAGHIGADGPRGSAGPCGSFLVEREISGVTAACSIMPRTVFDEAGGFSLLLPGNFNDVDLCMKVTQLGHDIYWTPNSELYHYESKTRHSRVSLYEVQTAWGRWEWRLDDPTYWPWGALLSDEEAAPPRHGRQLTPRVS